MRPLPRGEFLRLAKTMQDIKGDIQTVLEEGVASGELRADLDYEEAAEFIYSSLQGSILFAKALRGVSPIEKCSRQVLKTILQ